MHMNGMSIMLQVNDRLQDYAERVKNGLLSVDSREFEKVYETLKWAYLNQAEVMVCGNGGSLTMSEHFHCDHAKGIFYDAKLKPRIYPLTTASILTAIANDIGYDDVFSFQVDSKGRPGDILVAISASGNSPNIIKAIEKATEKRMTTVAFVGFDGGRASKIADIVLHVKEDNYGIVEDCHQSMMHILAQHIRSEYNQNEGIKL
jgi:D-sedoheptulose 7-phosphate isomerase